MQITTFQEVFTLAQCVILLKLAFLMQYAVLHVYALSSSKIVIQRKLPLFRVKNYMVRGKETMRTQRKTSNISFLIAILCFKGITMLQPTECLLLWFIGSLYFLDIYFIIFSTTRLPEETSSQS